VGVYLQERAAKKERLSRTLFKKQQKTTTGESKIEFNGKGGGEESEEDGFQKRTAECYKGRSAVGGKGRGGGKTKKDNTMSGSLTHDNNV